MSNAIQFLESLGRNQALVRPLGGDYARTVKELKIKEAQQDALISLDTVELGRLLNARDMMFCMISEPDQAPSKTPDDQDDDHEPDADDELDSKE